MKQNKSVKVIVVVAVLAIAVVGPAIASSNSNAVTKNTVIGVIGGPSAGFDGQVTVNGSYVASGDTVDIDTVNSGSIRVTSQGTGQVIAEDLGGTFTQLQEINTSGAPITVQDGSRASVRLAGGVDTFDYRTKSGIAADDNTVDYKYSASSVGSVLLRGAPINTTVAAVNSQGTTLDTGIANSSGVVSLALPSGSNDVRLQTVANNPPTASSGVTFVTPSGLNVTAGTNANLTTSNPFGPQSVTINNLTASASGGNVTVDQFNGPTTDLSSIETNGTQTINPGDKDPISYNGSVTAVDFADAARDDGQPDLVYSASGQTNITLNGLSNGRFGVASGVTPVTNGSVTNNQQTLSLGSATTKSLSLLTPSAPRFNESTASPTGDLTGDDVTLSVDVSDGDFPRDELNVSFYVDGNFSGNETIFSNGTADVSTTITTGGDHTWSAVANDSYGESNRTDSEPFAAGNQPFSITVPANLSIRNESAPSQLVTGGNISVTFFGSDTVAKRDDTNDDGKISFDGLPLDQRFEATINADGYESRTVVIPSLFKQENAYLLPDSVTTVEPRFVIDSAVPTFSETESEIIIERPINRSGSVEYRTITSAAPGVNGLDISLEKNQRYRITVRAPSGETRQIGGYQATATEQVTLEIESSGFEPTSTVSGIGFNSEFNGGSSPTVRTTIAGPDIQTSTITVRDATNDTVVQKRSFTGNASLITPASNGTQYNVSMTATLDSGKTITQTAQVSGRLPIGGGIDSQWLQLFSMAGLLLVGGLFTRANAGIGAIATASFGGILWYIGWFDGVITGLTVVLALFVGVLAYAKNKRGGVPT